MYIKDVISSLEQLAPPSYQEGYDNSGLIVGNSAAKVEGVLVCLDSTEEVLAEAKKKGCNLVVAHHPIVFGGLKTFTNSTYVERTVAFAIKHDIAIYAIHTNLDNVLHGVNRRIADKLSLTDTRALRPKSNVVSISITTSIELADQLRGEIEALSSGYFVIDTAYTSVGASTKGGDHVAAAKLEIQFPSHVKGTVQRILESAKQEEVLSYTFTDTPAGVIGSGLIGDRTQEVTIEELLKQVKSKFKAEGIRYTTPPKKKVKKIAVCGGSGSFLLKDAIRQGADVFLTADFKYHEFFDAEGKIMIVDIGHYESEQFTINLIEEYLTKKFPTFAVRSTKVNTNPINYY